jgi:hypothetical protein
MVEWKVGDRVTRQVFCDDGTWMKKGDSCLKRSPLRHGTVAKVYRPRRGAPIMYDVLWDPNEYRRGYFAWGLDAEVVATSTVEK